MKRFILPGILAAVASCNCPKTAQSAAQETVKQNVAKENWGNPNEVKAQGKFQLSGLAYGYSDLEPYIDGRTMSIHYSKHYLGYTNNLNKAIAGTALENQTIEEILAGLDLNNKAVRNNAGGYYNHTLFWEVMTPKKTTPKGATKEEIIDYALRTGAPMEVVENLEALEDEGEIYESIEEIWPDYPTEEDYLWNEDEY